MTNVETVSDVEAKSSLKERLRRPVLVSLVLAAMAIFLVMDLPPYLKAVAARDWPKVTGISRRSELASVLVGKDPAWRPIVIYWYRVDGRDYHNDVVNFQEIWGLGGFEAHQLKEKYQPGIAVSVFYNPRDPGDSCLEPNPDAATALIHLCMYGLFAALVYLSMYPRLPAD